MVYLNEKPVLMICDNTVYVKKLPAVAEILAQAECGMPYPGSKEHYILDMENAELVQATLSVLEQITPLPKKKKART